MVSEEDIKGPAIHRATLCTTLPSFCVGAKVTARLGHGPELNYLENLNSSVIGMAETQVFRTTGDEDSFERITGSHRNHS